MNLSWAKPLLTKSRQFIVRNASHIMMAVGTGASLSAVIFSAKMSPDAEDELEWQEKNKGSKLTAWEIVKIYGRYFGPAAAMEVLSLLCFWAAHGIDIRRQAVLSGLVATAEEALRAYQTQMKEMISEKAEKEIRNSVAQKQVDAHPIPATNTYLMDGGTERWWMIDRHYFKSTYQQIKDAQNVANHKMIQHMYLSRLELYWLLDPQGLYIKPDPNDHDGEVGWSVDDLIELDIDWATDPRTHEPIGVICVRDKDGFEYKPRPGFSAQFS